MPDPTDRYFQDANPNDIRFQFRIIEGLAESVRDLSRGISEMQKTQVGVLERLAKLEANRIAEVVADVRADVGKLDARVDALMRDKDERTGAGRVFDWFRIWGPVVFAAFTALYLFGRSVGIVPSPPVPQHTEQTRIDGK